MTEMAEGRKHGGWAIAKHLKDLGFERIFGMAGGHVMPLFDGCLTEGVQVVDTRHEQAAVHMAEGWATSTGEVAIAAVTAGPGATNAATGIVNAAQAGAPVVVFCGSTATHLDHKGAVQQLDATELYASVAKWKRYERDPARLTASMAEAIHAARSGRPGVAVLQIPMDVLMADAVPQAPWVAPADARGAPNPADVEAAVKLLETSERPVVLAGGGAHWSRAGDALRAFTERTGIPVTTTSAARGLLPDTHPNCLGYLLHGGMAVVGGDAVMILGSRFNANLVYGGPPMFNEGHKVIQVDVTAESLGGWKSIDVGMVGDIRLALEALTAAWTAPAERFDEWRGQVIAAAEMSKETWRQNWEHHPPGPAHPGRLAHEAVAAGRAACGDDITFVADGGDCLVWALSEFPALHAGAGLQTSTALGTLGVGVPFANAAALAHGHPVVAIIGDGAFGLAAMELDTAVRHGLPVVFCVSNNHVWGDVRNEAQNWFGKGRVIAAELPGTDYAALARALGAHGERAETPDEIRPAVERALATGGPALVDVETDPDVMSDLLKNLAEMGLM